MVRHWSERAVILDHRSLSHDSALVIQTAHTCVFSSVFLVSHCFFTMTVGKLFLVGLRVSGTALIGCRYVTFAADALSRCAKLFPLCSLMVAWAWLALG